MAKRIQLRRGTTTQHNNFTGALGEVTVDTDKKVLVVHDGATTGGFAVAARADPAGTVSLINKAGTVLGTIPSTGLLINNLTTSTTNQALTAAQGKVLQDSKFPYAGGTITGTLTVSGMTTLNGGVTTSRVLSTTPVSFLNGSAAQGVQVGSLLVSGNYSDANLVPANGAYIKGQVKSDGGFVGNATTATTFQTARTIAISGAVTGTATSFNGSANISIATTSIDASKILTGTIPAARIPTLNQSTTGNAATATRATTADRFTTARTINGVSFNGSTNIDIPVLGHKQYWLNVSSIRVKDVTYVNSTARPIAVLVTIRLGWRNTCAFYVNDESIAYLYEDDSSGDRQFSVIVPVNATYRLSGTSTSIGRWYELR